MAAEKRKSYSTRRQSDQPRKSQKVNDNTPARDTPANEIIAEPVEEPLPTKISNGKPLPVARTGRELNQEALQSIAESGVLEASLERSRLKWLGGGVFEKYWTKPPSKKKDQVHPPPNNPDRNTMTKLGGCRITIEPHVFDVILYTIKDVTAVKSKPAPKQPSQQNAFGGGFQSQMPTYPNIPMAQTPIFHQRDPTTMPMAFKTETLKPGSIKSTPSPASKQQKKNPTVPQPQPQPQPMPGSSSAGNTPAAKTGPDPVIQLLAQRASTNADLKALMKIVASGSASPDQLRVFQNHIDELTAIHQRQVAAKEAQAKKAAAAAAAAPKPKPPQSAFSQNGPVMPNTMFNAQYPTFSTYPSSSPNFAYDLHIQKPVTSAVPKVEVTTIALEFVGGNGDRFLLPKSCIMQYNNSGRQALLSFLYVRKPEPAKGTTGKKKEEELYQPITIRFWTDAPKIFETIAKSLNPADEVRKQMEEVMSKTKRADSVQLALQLPRESESANEESRSATPTALSRVSDRRQSLLKTSLVTLTPGTETPPKKGKPEHFVNQHCAYCFEAVSASAPKFEGKTVCPACDMLRKKDLTKSGAPRQILMSTMRHITAPQALIF